MAVTWEVEIAVVDLASKLASVTATRTDDSVTPSKVWSHGLTVLVDTTAKPLAVIRANVVDTIWDNYQAYVAAEDSKATLLAGWETALESDLDAKELI